MNGDGDGMGLVSQGTESPRSGLSRVSGRSWLPGVIVLLSCVAVAAVLSTQADPEAARAVDRTIYTSASWLLLGVLAVVGLVLVVMAKGEASGRHARLRLAALAVGPVVAAQVAGTGVWAAKHWESFYGVTGGGGVSLTLLQGLAVLLVAGGVAAGVACMAQLAGEGYLRRPSSGRGWLLLTLGIVVALALPWVIAAGEPQYTDFTSIGAFALIYSIPWGGGLVGAALLTREPAQAMAGAVAGTALLALVGPNMGDVGPSHPEVGFVVAIVAAGFLSVLHRHARD